jgi:murein DD-endopeptidase MepM/ murein hydrolase activator NlpD
VAAPQAAGLVVAPASGDGPGRLELAVQRGDTLLDILVQAGIAVGEAHDAVASLREIVDLRRLQIGQRLALELEPVTNEDGQQRLAQLALPVDAATEVHLVRDDDGTFEARSIERPLSRELVRTRGAIAGSLYESARATGMPHETLGQMIKLLSWDVDFQRDVQPGDRFESVYERHVNDQGELTAGGELLFATLAMRGREVEAYRFTPPDGEASFFDREGRALRKWLLKTPIDGARLSSVFGPRRHPVLGYTRMHQGIDFAAPRGTPILAAGDGVVAFVGRNGGYGRYVRLMHNDDYSTAYAHLSGVAAGLARGSRVKQGEVIGFVGATGIATGPHLHYELLHHDAQVNPLSVKVAFASQLQGPELRRFLKLRDQIDGLRQRPGRESVVAQRTD